MPDLEIKDEISGKAFRLSYEGAQPSDDEISGAIRGWMKAEGLVTPDSKSAQSRLTESYAPDQAPEPSLGERAKKAAITALTSLPSVLQMTMGLSGSVLAGGGTRSGRRAQSVYRAGEQMVSAAPGNYVEGYQAEALKNVQPATEEDIAAGRGSFGSAAAEALSALADPRMAVRSHRAGVEAAKTDTGYQRLAKVLPGQFGAGALPGMIYNEALKSATDPIGLAMGAAPGILGATKAAIAASRSRRAYKAAQAIFDDLLAQGQRPILDEAGDIVGWRPVGQRGIPAKGVAGASAPTAPASAPKAPPARVAGSAIRRQIEAAKGGPYQASPTGEITRLPQGDIVPERAAPLPALTQGVEAQVGADAFAPTPPATLPVRMVARPDGTVVPTQVSAGDVGATAASPDNWFTGSKVADDKGKPITVYHGTENGTFEEFQTPAFFTEDIGEAKAYTKITDTDDDQIVKYRPASEVTLPEKIDWDDSWPGYSDYDGPPNEIAVNGNTGRLFYWDGTTTPVGTKNIVIISGAEIDDSGKVVLRKTSDTEGQSASSLTPRVYKVHLSIKNPIELPWDVANRLGKRLGADPEDVARQVAEWKAQGYDGIVTKSDDAHFFQGRDVRQWIPFDSSQIRSADKTPAPIIKSPGTPYSLTQAEGPRPAATEGVTPDAAPAQPNAPVMPRSQPAPETVARPVSQPKPTVPPGAAPAPEGAANAAPVRETVTPGKAQAQAQPEPEPPAPKVGTSTEKAAGVTPESLLNRNEAGQKIGTTPFARLRNAVVEGMSNLRRVAPDLNVKASRLGNSRAEAAAALHTTLPEIDKVAGTKDYHKDFLATLHESRLAGIQQRWRALSDDVLHTPITDFEELYQKQWSGPADSIGANRAVEKALADGNVFTAKDELVKAFGDASARTKRYLSDADLAKNIADPRFAKARAVYQERLEKPLNASHATNEGVFSADLGPAGTYVPLVPTDAAGNLKRGFLGRRNPALGKPGNPRNKMATGLSDEYDRTSVGLREALTRAYITNNRADLVKSLKESGLLRRATEADLNNPNPSIVVGGKTQLLPGGGTVTTGGEEFAGVVVRTDAHGNKAVIPQWLAEELKPILEPGGDLDFEASGAVLENIFTKLNTYGMVGPMDAIFHAKNVFGVLMANTPYLSKSLAGKMVGNIPAVKAVQLALRVALQKSSERLDPEKLRYLAKIGALPNRALSETYSKELAGMTGAEHKKFSFGPALLGPNGIDLRARTILLDIAREINPKATDIEIRDFVNQVGAYNVALESQLERALKRSGVQPFATAAKTMTVGGIKGAAGISPLPTKGLTRAQRSGLRIMQQVSGGALAMVASWAVAYKGVTGEWPDWDSSARVGHIPIGKGKDGKERTIDMFFVNPLAKRALRSSGALGAMNAYLGGGDVTQIGEAGIKDVMNTGLHMTVGGPAIQGAIQGVTGKEPYITSLRDQHGKPNIEFMDTAVPKAARRGGVVGAAARLAGAVPAANPQVAEAMRLAGWTEKPKTPLLPAPGSPEEKTLLQNVLAIAVPEALYDPTEEIEKFLWQDMWLIKAQQAKMRYEAKEGVPFSDLPPEVSP